MNSFVSYRNLLITRGDPPRGAYTGGRALLTKIEDSNFGDRVDELTPCKFNRLWSSTSHKRDQSLRFPELMLDSNSSENYPK